MGQLIRVQLFNDDISVHSSSQLFPWLKSINVFIYKPQQYTFIREKNKNCRFFPLLFFLLWHNRTGKESMYHITSHF
jgi:hypothetical protein